MNVEKITQKLETAPDAAEFDVLGYLEDEVPVADDTVTVYVDLKNARRLHQLIADRHNLIVQRQKDRQAGKAETLSIDESDEDTEYDDEINSLLEELEKTALTFHLKSVAPALRKAIDKHYVAVEDKDWDEDQKAQHNADRISDILSRSIDFVVRGDGAEDRTPWDKDRFTALETKLHEKEFERLMSATWDMVYVGDVFEQAINADFS